MNLPRTARTLRLTLACIWLLPASAFSQFESVELDLSAGWFNNGQDLPSETKLIINGQADPGISYMEMYVWRGGSDHSRPPLYRADWRKLPGESSNRLRMLFNYSLNGNSEYDFRFDAFRYLTGEEQAALEHLLVAQTNGYIYSVVASRDGSRKTWTNGLNESLLYQMADYRNEIGKPFTAFSPVLEELLDRFQNTAKDTTGKDSALLGAISRQTAREIRSVVRTPLLVKVRSYEINRYETTAERTPLGLSAGYGGAYLSGNFENLDYASGPFVGVSFPFSTRGQAPSVLRRTAFCLGVFVTNFENEQGDVVSGPVLNRPYFAAIGYQAFRFVRIQAGATVLETRKTNVLPVANIVTVGPFVGLSLELGLWLGLNTIR